MRATQAFFGIMARERGWHIGSYCNGTRWVLAHLPGGCDGREYFEQHHGEASVCRTPEGKPWEENWDAAWRPSYASCMGVEQTRELALDFVRRLIGWGLESLQFFDQNLSAVLLRRVQTDLRQMGDTGLEPVTSRV